MDEKNAYQQTPTQRDLEAAIAGQKSYYTAALITLVLYWLLFWIGGFIANLVYLNSANNAKNVSGKSPEGMGCLWILIAVHVILPVAAALCLVSSTSF